MEILGTPGAEATNETRAQAITKFMINPDQFAVASNKAHTEDMYFLSTSAVASISPIHNAENSVPWKNTRFPDAQKEMRSTFGAVQTAIPDIDATLAWGDRGGYGNYDAVVMLSQPNLYGGFCVEIVTLWRPEVFYFDGSSGTYKSCPHLNTTDNWPVCMACSADKGSPAVTQCAKCE